MEHGYCQNGYVAPPCVCLCFSLSLSLSLSLPLPLSPSLSPHSLQELHFLSFNSKLSFLYIALAINCQSPAAFEALSSFKLLQLPGAYRLKCFTHRNKEDHGERANQLAHERAMYDNKVCEEKKHGNPLPLLSEGTLIADEVKVAAKLHWNSRDDNIAGISMTPDEMATLKDLYTWI